MGKSLWVLVVVAVVAVAIFLILNGNIPITVPTESKLTFEEGKSDIAGIWQKNGVSFDSSNPLAETSKLNALKSGLTQYKQELNSKPQSREKDALLKYSDIQLKIVDGMIAFNEMDEDYVLFLQFSGDFDATCQNIESLESLSSNLKELNKVNIELAAQGKEFRDSFPEYAGEAPEQQISSSSGGIDSQIEQLSALCLSGGLA
ncbi:MAG: hypothetical protein V1494_06750 [Candidatus Diapherotrites archaeon]